MEQVTKDFEQQNIKEQKKFFVDIQKQINHDYIQSISKTKQKKFENNALQSYGQTNSTLGISLSLDNAIMYMQNVLSVIEHKIQNEIRYSLNFKQIVAGQIAKLDLTQQVFYEDLKGEVAANSTEEGINSGTGDTTSSAKGNAANTE